MRVAIFVDAGYLFARGSVVLTGKRIRRIGVKIDQQAILAKLCTTADHCAPGSSLLRIYWYDGVLPEGPSDEQQALADANNVKLRLGVINAFGQQKGVDSLIVTDLVELARNHAISDAVLLSGDEDVRIGVQIAQSYGVRVHLIGIGVGRESQSRTLLQEADTKVEWSRDEISEVMEMLNSAEPHPSLSVPQVSLPNHSDTESMLDEVVDESIASLEDDELRTLAELEERSPIPWEIDRWLLGTCRGRVGRDLSEPEKWRLRDRFKQAVRDASQTP